MRVRKRKRKPKREVGEGWQFGKMSFFLGRGKRGGSKIFWDGDSLCARVCTLYWELRVIAFSSSSQALCGKVFFGGKSKG